MIGKRILHYEITEKLGEGGMGVVFKARDARLKRDVAIKFLPRRFGVGAAERERFETEARAAAALNHPNIAHVYAIEEADGEMFIVMEYIAGRELRDLMGEGRLAPDRAVDIATRIATGLKAAHDRGIVHRDIKTANVMVTDSGDVKITDFGLAKMHGGERLTRSGMTVGTTAYMSPEQARGAETDHRTDIWSFGVVLYEMLTGELPFAGDYDAAVIYSIMNVEPKPPSALVTGLPRAADELVGKALARDREERYQSMDRVIGALERLKDAISADGPALPGIGEPAVKAGPSPRAGGAALSSVAVLPFVNMSNDPENEFFADGITEDVIAHLAKIRTLRVTSRTSVMVFKRREQSLREIGAALGVEAIVEGSVRHARNRVRIVAQLVDPRTDEHLWAESYDRDMDDIFAIQTDVALQITAALRAELTMDEHARIAARPTNDLDAYQLYLQGQHLLTRFTEDGFTRSIAFFERAVARDPRFALAYAAMAHAHIEIGITGVTGVKPLDAFARAQAAVERALALDNGLAAAHGMSGLLRFVRDFDWAGAEAELRLGLQLSPSNADICDHLGWLCSAQRRFDESLEFVKMARERDPMAHHSDVANELLRAGRLQEALDEAERTVAIHPDYVRTHSVLGWARLALGKTEAGLSALERAVEIAPESTLFLSQLGQAYASTGNEARARMILAELEARAGREYVADSHFAYVYTGLGEYDQAIDYLERAFEARAAIYGIKGSHLLAPLREHPRFQALLRRMNL